MKDKWIKRWQVPGSNGNVWTVAIDKDGNYGCSCPAWKFRRLECRHIQHVKTCGPKPGTTTEIKKPDMRPYNIEHPEYDEKQNLIKYPLVRLGGVDLSLEVEIDVMMMQHGYSTAEVKERRHLPNSWTRRAIYHHYKQTKEDPID